MYPGSQIPPLLIYALSVDRAGLYYSVATTLNQFTYNIPGVMPGTYHVIAYLQSSPGNGFAGGYSRAVPCGLLVSCTDHTLIDVPVSAGAIVTGINPSDWYAPPGAFPLPPGVTPAPSPLPQPGAISGDRLMYPSSQIPPLIIYAVRVGAPSQHYSVLTSTNQFSYTISGIAPGTYHVLAYRQADPGGGLVGGYSRAVPCGLLASCTDHTLIDVPVSAGATVTGVNPNDWYAPPGAFPPPPA